MRKRGFIARSYVEPGRGVHPWVLVTPNGVYGSQCRKALEWLREHPGEALPEGVHQIEFFK